MAKRLGIVFAAFMVLVGINYIATSIAGALSSIGPSGTGNPVAVLSQAFAAPSIAPVPQFPVSGGGLSSVDLSFFNKDGSGRTYITQGYGDTAYAYLYVNHWHDGIDIAAKYGAPVYSPGDGIVFAIGNQDLYCPGKGFGKYVAVVDTVNNIILWYAHLGTIDVQPGEDIHKGAEIGTIGATGFEMGTHLHFSVFDTAGFSMKAKYGCGPDPDGKDLNPLSYLGVVYK